MTDHQQGVTRYKIDERLKVSKRHFVLKTKARSNAKNVSLQSLKKIFFPQRNEVIARKKLSKLFRPERKKRLWCWSVFLLWRSSSSWLLPSTSLCLLSLAVARLPAHKVTRYLSDTRHYHLRFPLSVIFYHHPASVEIFWDFFLLILSKVRSVRFSAI